MKHVSEVSSNVFIYDFDNQNSHFITKQTESDKFRFPLRSEQSDSFDWKPVNFQIRTDGTLL